MVDAETLDEMFRLAGLEKAKLHRALAEMGANYSDTPKLWTPERVTIGYSAVVSEAVYCYFPLMPSIIPILLKGENELRRVLGFSPNAVAGTSKAKRILSMVEIDNQTEAPHVIIDLTADETDDLINYNAASRKLFPYPSPSKRAQLLAKKLGKTELIRRGDKWKS